MAKAKILMIDDNPDIVEMVQIRLEGNDYQVINAYNGPEALGKAKNEKPDLILLDIAMPEMDGFEVGRRLRLDDDTKDIPIIMVTAKGEHRDVMRSINDIGAVDYVMKPFQPKVLIKKIEAALSKGK